MRVKIEKVQSFHRQREKKRHQVTQQSKTPSISLQVDHRPDFLQFRAREGRFAFGDLKDCFWKKDGNSGEWQGPKGLKCAVSVKIYLFTNYTLRLIKTVTYHHSTQGPFFIIRNNLFTQLFLSIRVFCSQKHRFFFLRSVFLHATSAARNSLLSKQAFQNRDTTFSVQFQFTSLLTVFFFPSVYSFSEVWTYNDSSLFWNGMMVCRDEFPGTHLVEDRRYAKSGNGEGSEVWDFLSFVSGMRQRKVWRESKMSRLKMVKWSCGIRWKSRGLMFQIWNESTLSDRLSIFLKS